MWVEWLSTKHAWQEVVEDSVMSLTSHRKWEWAAGLRSKRRSFHYQWFTLSLSLSSILSALHLLQSFWYFFLSKLDTGLWIIAYFIHYSVGVGFSWNSLLCFNIRNRWSYMFECWSVALLLLHVGFWNGVFEKIEDPCWSNFKKGFAGFSLWKCWVTVLFIMGVCFSGCQCLQPRF